ncbi:MAG: Ig-like domain-containing protein [Maledivibacter sp.]|nr:Ig-like domain-containing protein [Maledivibacter sp.]
MKALKIRKTVSIFIILSMLLSMTSPIVAEDLLEIVSIEISGETTVGVGNTIELTAVVKDQHGEEIEGEEITWSSEDETKAEVDETTGEVTGLEAGDLTIKATSNTNPDVTQTIEINVEKVEAREVASIEISGETTVEVGNTIELTAVVKDQHGKEVEGEEITWSSEDETKAEVDETTGEVTGLEAGDLTIKAISNTNPEVTQTIEISVEKVEAREVASIEISGETTVEVGNTIELTAVVKDQHGEEIEGEEITWSSEDETKAKVDETTGEVTGVQVGSVTIKVKSNKNSEATQIIEIKVGEATTQEGNKENTIEEIKNENNSELLGEEVTKLAVVSLTPSDKASGVKEGSEIKIKFNEAVESLEGENDLYTEISRSKDGKLYKDIYDIYGEKEYLLELENDSNGEATIGVFRWADGKTITLDKNYYYRAGIPTGIIKFKDSGKKLDGIAWEFDTIQQPLAVESLVPLDKASGVEKNTEINVIFNKKIQLRDAHIPVKVLVFYDEDNDGKANDIYGSRSKHELILNQDYPQKLEVHLKDENGNSIELKEGHVYKIDIAKESIEFRDGEKIEVLDENIIWTFDTKLQTIGAESPIDGRTISPEDEIFMRMSQDVDEDYINGLYIYLYKGQELITEGTGADLAELDDYDKGKIIIHLNNKLAIGNSYKIKVCYDESERIKDLITICFNVDELGKYGLEIKLDFLRREAVSTGMQDFISAGMNDGVVYAIRDNGAKGQVDEDGIRIYAFDLYGHEIWNTRIDDIHTSNKPYIPAYGDDGTVYIQTKIEDFNNSKFETQLFAISPDDGRVRWKQRINESGLSETNPIIIDDEIVITSKKGLYRYTKNGNEKWHYIINKHGLNRKLEDYRIEQPPIKDKNNNIYIAIKGKNSSIKDGKIQVLNSDGIEKWSYITNDGVLTPVVDNKGNVYVVDNNCTIKVLNSSDGTIVKDHPMNDYILKTNPHDYDIVSINLGVDNTVYVVICNNDIDKSEIIAINSNGTENYIYKDSNHEFDDLVIDHEGYAYYPETIDGGGALFVIGPYGNKVSEILPVGGTMPNYNNIYIDGNVLLGAKSYSTNVIGAKIKRRHTEHPASIEIIEKNKKLGVNLNETLAVAVRNIDGKVMIGEELEWVSSDNSIVEVDKKNGTLICKKTGEVEISVNIKGTNIIDRTTVEVIAKPSTPTIIKILDKNGEEITDELTVEYGVPYQFQVEVLDQYGNLMADEEVIWYSIINYFSTIDHTGLLNPKSEGIYYLDVISCTDVRVTGEITYKVKKGPSVYRDIFPKEAVTAFPGSVTLSPVNQYDNAIELGDIKWASSNESIATVNQKGRVTALSCGTTNIEGSTQEMTHTRKLHVVPSFGYEWHVNSNRLSQYMAEGNNEEIYYIEAINGHNELVSINRNDEMGNWRLNLGTYIDYIETGQDNTIYCLVRDKHDDYEVKAINTDKTIKWEYKSDNIAGSYIDNIEQSCDGTVYFAVASGNHSRLYAIDSDGNKKWDIEFNNELYSFELDNEENIICVAQKYGDSILTTISDKGNEISKYVIEDITFGNGNMQVDDNGVVYLYFSEELNKFRGVCAVENGIIKWKYYGLRGTDLASNPKIILDNKERLYFILEESKNNYSFCALDNQGKELWKKKLNNLTDDIHILVPMGSFIVDDEGNICVVAVEYEKKHFNLTAVKSKVLRINPEGNVIQYVSYDKDKYGQFINTFLNKTKDSLYIIGTYGKNGDSLVKFNFENNQEIRIDEIKITADKESIIVNEILDLKADVYNQFGSIMHNERVTWSIQNEEIATVDDMGHVKGISTGRTNIVATSITNPQIEKVFPIIVVDANAHNISKDQIDKKTQSAINYYKKKGIPQGDWIAFGLSAAGENINKSPYLSDGRSYIDSLWNTISANDEFELITDYVKATLGILSGRYDPHNFGEMNLIEKIYGYGSLGQGNNAAVWALIALDAAEAEVPEDKGYFTQEFLIDYLLKHKDGAGWSVDGEDTDIDVTGMALYALAPYKDRENVKESVNETVEWLKKQQNEHGGFDCFGTDITNTESTAQIIMGLTALGIDPQDSAFIRGYGNPVSAMLNNQLSDGSFEHTKGTGSNNIATEQALQALAALKDFYKNGKSTIFYHIPYNKNIADVTVRIEGKNKTLLPLTRVNITSGETTLYDAVTHALEEANIYHEGANNNITSINGEKGWQWLVFKDKTLKTNSLPTDILYGEEEIILADESIINPVYTTINVPTKELGVGKKFPVYVYGSNNQPIAGVEIIYSKADGLPADTGIKTGVDGRAWVTINEEGEFLISARGNAIIRPSAEEIHLYNKKEITVDFRIEGPNSPILPHCMGKVYAGDYPNDILKKYKHDLTFDEGKNIIDAPKAIDGVEGNPYWGLYTRANDFDIPLKDGDYIIFTGNGTCTRTATIYIPKEVEVDKEFQVIIKDDYGNPIPNEEIFIDPVGISPLVSTGISTDENGRGKLVIDKTGSYWIGIYCKTKGLVRPESKEVFVKEEILQPEDQVTVKVTIEGYRGKKILNNYQVTTDIFDLQPYLRPGTGPTAKPTNDWYADKFHKPTVAHAVVRALEKKGINYDFQDYGWRLYFAMIGGYREKEINEKSGWMYEINGKLGPSVQDQYIKDGDRIRLWFTVGGWENPDLIGGDGLLDIINDEYATEEEILDALKKGVNKIKGNVNKLKSEEAAKKLVEDIEDMARAIGKAENRIDTEKCRKEVLRETIDLMKALKKSSQIVKDKKIKTQIDKAAGAVIETIMKLMDRQKDLKEIDNILDEIIKISGEIKNNIGKENSNKLELEIIEAVEGAINKSSIKEVKDRDISKEGDRVIVSVGTRLITESAEGLMERVKDLEEKLKNNNIEKNKRLERKITIKIPTRRIEEVQTILPSGILDSVAKAGINNIEIQTDVASFNITPNAFKDSIKEKEISLNAKISDEGEILKTSENTILKGSIIVDLDAKIAGEKISTFEEPIEVSIPYKEKVSYEEQVTVYLLRDDGTIEAVGGIYDAETKTVKFITNHFSKYFAKEASMGFNDLGKVSWARNEIEAMAAKGVIKGRDKEKFDPNAKITRAEFATLMTRMLKYKAENKDIPFKDITNDKWYYEEVAAAYENGLMEGISHEEFNPEGNITGQEAITVMERILVQKGYKEASLEELKGYSQRDNIAEWAKPSIAFGIREGIINEDKKEDFIPNAKATRVQIAVMIYRLYHLIIK